MKRTSLLFGSLIILSSLVIIFLLKRNEVLKERFTQSDDLLYEYKYERETYVMQILKLVTEFKAVKIIDNNSSIKDSTGRNTSLKEIIQKNNNINDVLIFRFKEESCNSCYENQFLKLKLLKQLLSPNSIVLFVSFKNNKNLKILSQTYDLHFPIYNISNNLLFNLPLEGHIEPYLFRLNSELNASDFFEPYKGLDYLNDKYYEMIQTKLNKK